VGAEGFTLDEETIARLRAALEWIEGQKRNLVTASRRKQPLPDAKVRYCQPQEIFELGSTIDVHETNSLGVDVPHATTIALHVACNGLALSTYFTPVDVLRWRKYAAPDHNGIVGVLVGLLEEVPPDPGFDAVLVWDSTADPGENVVWKEVKEFECP